jgi:hypothetical protein
MIKPIRVLRTLPQLTTLTPIASQQRDHPEIGNHFLSFAIAGFSRLDSRNLSRAPRIFLHWAEGVARRIIYICPGESSTSRIVDRASSGTRIPTYQELGANQRRPTLERGIQAVARRKLHSVADRSSSIRNSKCLGSR